MIQFESSFLDGLKLPTRNINHQLISPESGNEQMMKKLMNLAHFLATACKLRFWDPLGFCWGEIFAWFFFLVVKRWSP